MEFEGTVYKILPLTKGTSARGDWQRQDVVFEMNEGSFARKICVTFFNKPDDVARLREGAAYNVSVNVESREYNGRWYTARRSRRSAVLTQTRRPLPPAVKPGKGRPNEFFLFGNYHSGNTRTAAVRIRGGDKFF